MTALVPTPPEAAPDSTTARYAAGGQPLHSTHLVDAAVDHAGRADQVRWHDNVAAGGSSLPDGASIVGALWRALRLSLPANRRETGRKFLAGQRPGDVKARTGLLRAMASEIVRAGYLGPLDEQDPGDVIELLVKATARSIAHWDHVVGRVSAASGPGGRADLALRYLRVASLDTAIRVAAFEVWIGCPARPAALGDGDAVVPRWARAGGVRDQLRAVPAALGVSWDRIYAGSAARKAKDDWLYRGSRPSLASLEELARRLAAHDRSAPSPGAWQLFLAWDFALDSLCDALATVIERSAVEDIAAAFHHTRVFARAQLAGEPPATLRELIIRGAHSLAARRLIEQLVSGEREAMTQVIDRLASGEMPDLASNGKRAVRTGWVRDLRACSADWKLCQLATVISRDPFPPDGVPSELLLPMARALAAADLDALTEMCREHPAALLWIVRTTVHQALFRGLRDALVTMLPMLSQAADILGDPAWHFDVVVLCMAARDPARALRHCEQIVRISPVTPAVSSMIAGLQVFTGAHVEALETLEALRGHPLFDYLRGVALRRVGRLEDALQAFDHVLSVESSHVGALEQAARTAYALRRRRLGNRYARAARRLGCRVQPVSRRRRRA